jgi:rubredoxin
MLRSPDFEVEKDFSCEVGITKSWQEKNGRRFIQGVASGVAEDHDGERVSANAISKMASQVEKGGVKLTSRHQQDWDTEIGDVVSAFHDPETDELVVKTELPPEGQDPIADKAWNMVTKQGVKLGFSIGGKLKKAYFEMVGVGKRRKVLDEIFLRHVCLTKTPSYAPSFAEAVAKTFTDDGIVDDDAFYEAPDDDEVVKGISPSDTSQPSATGDDNAGSREQGAPSKDVDDPDKDEDDEPKLDKSPERHLACPNCGHEFAADLPLEGEEQAPDTDSEADDDNDSTKKSVEQENDMPKSLRETLDELNAFVAKSETPEAEVEKTAEPEVEVEKTEDAIDNDVLKTVAAAKKMTDERFDSLEGSLGEAFGTVAKAIKDLQDSILEQPQGRRSVARILPAKGEDEEVGKSQEDMSATDLLKQQNASNPAYAQYHRS